MKKIISIIMLSSIALISCDSSVKDNDDELKFEQSSPGGAGGGQTTTSSGKFRKHALLEDYTGTWCGYCPRVVYKIQQALSQGIAVIPVTVHRNDDYHFADATPMMNQFNIVSFPSAILDRSVVWSEEADQIKPFVNTDAKVGIAMKSKIASGNISLNVKMKFGVTMSNLKMVVYILENNLIHNQANYTNYFGGTAVLYNFDNDYVLRTSLTGMSGEAVSGSMSEGAILGKNYSIAIPSNISNPSNISFVAVLLDSSGKVVNARSSASNINQLFEEI